MNVKLVCVFCVINVYTAFTQNKGEYNNQIIDGYRPIWFDLGQKTEYGSKYSGGLGTYTVKHNPMAIYSPEVEKTFFVYGGTISKEDKYLLCMIGCYDHKTGMVSKPTVVHDKQGVNDPHDNPALLIDKDGFLWVYIAGRGNHRPGLIYKSVRPYDITAFQWDGFKDVMAYPQPRYIQGKGHFLFFTRYDGERRLFFRTSTDGLNWSNYQQIASIIAPGETKSGHYQITGQYGNKLVTTFNRHINGDCDTRTNIYYLQSIDFGKTWTLADGTPIEIPITDKDSPCKVLEMESLGQNVYIKDVNFDIKGNPIVLYLTSFGHLPGPQHSPRKWFVAHWTGIKWENHYITTSTHNYDSGSLFVDGELWRLIAPTEPGPQYWGTGGEVVSWVSKDAGNTWNKEYQYTKLSPRNHSYMRRPVDAKDPFYTYWADGNSDCFSISYLYMGDSKGNVYRLPYVMSADWVKPEKIDYSQNEKSN
ncbi:MAG: BNR-4 repeat-containing protein [Lachnospiraceae bacterium]|nr:BNR-4 repeat-containing protein [Lachnospiraceae bacterium]